MSVGIINFFNFNQQFTPAKLDDYSFTGIWSLRKVYEEATSCIRIIRSSDNTQTDIGFVGDDLDTAAINTFCSGTNCFIQIFYDQSGNGRNATHTGGGIRAKIYDSSTGLNTTDGKVSCRFSNNTQYTYTAVSNTESIYFVANNINLSTLNYIIHSSTTGNGITINNNYWNPKFGTVNITGGEFGRGLTFLSGRNLGSFVYSATASLYMMNRNAGADTFGDQFGGSQNSGTTLPKFTFDRIGRDDGFNLSLNGDFQELLLGASGSNTGLSNKDTINTLINDYWEVY